MGGSRDNGRTVLVSFSGIDGAGKSTQIEALASHLRQDGLRVQVIRFWDDVARLKIIRESAGHKIFKGDKGVGRPEAPIERRDKNVQSPWMTCVRLFLYLVDAVSVRLMVQRALKSGYDLVIFDRYTYDELANLNLENAVIQAYARMIMALVPRLHVSFVLDADPVRARERKPEYPLDFLRQNRGAYLRLADLVGGMTVIGPKPVSEVSEAVIMQTAKKLSYEEKGFIENKWVMERQ